VDKLLEEAETIIEKEGWYSYHPEKHREILSSLLKKGAGERNLKNFDPWMKFFKKGEIPIFSGKRIEVRNVNIGGISVVYIRLEDFMSLSNRQKFKDAVERASCDGRPIIIDLRGNKGGYLALCVEVASIFTQNAEEILLTEKYKTGKEEKYRAGDMFSFIKNGSPIKKPAILVDEWTASASELFAETLRQWGSPLVGDRTCGKGVSQKGFALSDGSVIYLTVAECFAGNKRIRWDRKGIEPDYYVRDNRKLFPGLTATEKDRQFMKAVEVVKKMK